MQETQQYFKILDNVAKAYEKLPDRCAAEAVNFFKERFTSGVDIYNKPFKKRSDKAKRNKGRAILVDKGVLKRDIRKVFANAKAALISTSRLTVPYAKAHNEGFEGTVTVKAHQRQRYKKVKEKYTTKKGNERTRTSKQFDNSKATISVRTHQRKMKIEQRQFMGVSPLLIKRIDWRMFTDIATAIKQST